MTEPAPSRFPLSILKPLAGQALEVALNQLLALDADTRTALAALTGRTLTLTLTAPPLAAQIRVDGERLRVGAVDAAVEPDLAIRSTLGGALGGLRRLLGVTADAAPPPAIGEVRVAGDAQLARALQRLIERFDPDWQRPFVAVFGEVLGVQVAGALAAALRGMKDSARALTDTTADWLHEESRLTVPQAAMDAFADEVAGLETGVSQLAARVARLGAGNGA